MNNADLLTPDEREAKLPSWVRSTLLDLRNKIAEQKAQLAIAHEEALAKGCTGKVIADGLLRNGFPLHDRALVSFRLPNGKIDCMLRENGTLLDVNASSGILLIRPCASNAAYLMVGER